jgi:hypothetical protein
MNSKYLNNQIRLKAKRIERILKDQKKQFIEILQNWNELKAWKAFSPLDEFLSLSADQVPNYLYSAIPAIMNQAIRDKIKEFSQLKGFSLGFDLPTSPASNYIRDRSTLMLSTRQGSILKTTRDQLRGIIATGLDNGLSYSDIAEQIQKVDTYVFSKGRAKAIAQNEVGRAYGWAQNEGMRELAKEYVIEKLWVTSHDEKVRPEHNANAEEGWIPFEAMWQGTNDTFAPSSTDYNCRCFQQDRIV